MQRCNSLSLSLFLSQLPEKERERDENSFLARPGRRESVRPARTAICPRNNRRSVHFRTLRDSARYTHTQLHTHTHTHRLRRLCNQVQAAARERKDSCTWGYSRRRYRIADFLLRAAAVIFHDNDRNNFQWYFMHSLNTPDKSQPSPSPSPSSSGAQQPRSSDSSVRAPPPPWNSHTLWKYFIRRFSPRVSISGTRRIGSPLSVPRSSLG